MFAVYTEYRYSRNFVHILIILKLLISLVYAVHFAK